MSRRHFGPQHLTNGYAEMGGALHRPYYAGLTKKRSVHEAIAEARRQAAAEARRSAKGKK